MEKKLHEGFRLIAVTITVSVVHSSVLRQSDPMTLGFPNPAFTKDTLCAYCQDVHVPE